VSTPILRPGTAEDAAPVADLWHESWHLAHAGHVPDGLTAARTLAAFHERTPGRVDVTTVAEVDGRVVGFTILDGAELEQLFVAPDQRGGGVAALLLADAEAKIARAGHRVAWLAVVDGNARARAFYAKHGWVDEGDLPYPVTAGGEEFISPCRRYTKRVG
jgi:putative acetyltransferase